MNTRLFEGKISPYLLIKQSIDSKYSAYNALNYIRIFRSKSCPPLQMASDGSFLLTGNAYNDLIANSLNQLELSELNYCLCDFLNSKIEVSDVTFIGDFVEKVNVEYEDKEIDHQLLGFFKVVNALSGNDKDIRTVLPFNLLHSKNDNAIFEYRHLHKDSQLNTLEITKMLSSYAIDSFDVEPLNAGKTFLVKLIDNFEKNSIEFTLSVCEGLNFVRIFGKPCLFMIKVQSLHYGCIILPLFEVNKYKILTISRPHNDLSTEILKEIRRLAYEFKLLREDFFLSGQHITYDYKFNSSFDIKILLSMCKVIPYYTLEDRLSSVRQLLKDLDEWNNYPFSIIEEFLNSLYGANSTNYGALATV